MAKLCLLVILIVQCSAFLLPYEKPLCPPHVGARCKDNGAPSHSEFQFRVDGDPVTIIFQDGKDLRIPCLGNVTLDNDALPRFPRRISVQSVFLESCPAPNNSIAITLAALNVTSFSRLYINRLPAEPLLKKSHFDDLKISSLVLRANRKVSFEADLLSNLNLTDLRMRDVSVKNLPIGLRVLHLINSGITPLPVEVVKSLQELLFYDSNLSDVSELGNATELKILKLRGHIGDLPSMPKLEELMLEEWVLLEPKPFANCEKLRILTVVSSNVKNLPNDWLAGCPNLYHLDLMLENLEGLPPHLLRGAGNLHEVLIRRSKLKQLPVELFESTNSLTVLNLSANKLEYLPSGIFSKSPDIQDLNLSRNQLKAPNAHTIATLLSLRNLTLSYNPLGSMCNTGTASVYIRKTSALSPLRKLRRLMMARAEIPYVCEDWISGFPDLEFLDLRNNAVKKLRYHNLVPPPGAEVDLKGNNITTIDYFSDDCFTVVNGGGKVSTGTVIIDSKLFCDCDLYKFAFARQTLPKHVNVNSLKCSNGEDLVNILPKDLYCELKPPYDCVPGCVCEFIPSSSQLTCNATFGVRARCNAKALSVLYALGMDPIELTVTGLEDLSVLKLNSTNLEKINLKNNNISNASPEDSRMLMSRKRQVLLSGNPLNCACGERHLVEQLLNHPDQIEDLSEVQCSNKRYLNELKRGECTGLPSGALAALAVLAVAAFAAMALSGVLASPELRLRFKIFLYKLGITIPCIRVNEEEEEKQYDAFISFSHHDGRLVMEQLVPVLEKDYRLCLHYRDWPVGGWIPEQISNSVRDSRRTIIVVSENYARSDWARAEFREAHAAAMRDAHPRLLAILLQEPPPELDPELKLYLSTNTYVKWGDPAFWDKLKYAMPHRRTKKFIPEAA